MCLPRSRFDGSDRAGAKWYLFILISVIFNRNYADFAPFSCTFMRKYRSNDRAPMLNFGYSPENKSDVYTLW